MVQQNNLRLALVSRVLANEQVARVRVAVDEAVLEYHLGEGVNEYIDCLDRALRTKLLSNLLDIVNSCATDPLHDHSARAAIEWVSFWQVEVDRVAEVVPRFLKVDQFATKVSLEPVALVEYRVHIPEIDRVVTAHLAHFVSQIEQLLQNPEVDFHLSAKKRVLQLHGHFLSRLAQDCSVDLRQASGGNWNFVDLAEDILDATLMVALVDRFDFPEW